VVGACSGEADRPFQVLYSVGDGLPAAAGPLAAGDPTTLDLPETASLQITLLERDGAAWHALRIVSPEDTTLAGPGVLLPGPMFDVGPYPAGPVLIQLDVYNNYPPNEFWRIAGAQILGAYPSWTIRFEDSSDGDYNDIVIGVEATPALPEELTLMCSPGTVERVTQDVTCAPAVPAGSTFEITGWRFEGEGFNVISEGTPPAVWTGPMAVSGTVWVRGLLDGILDSVSAAVVVTPRAWPAPLLATPVPELPDTDPAFDLANPPTQDHDLGQAGHAPVMDPQYPSSPMIGAITSGPNYLLFYNAQPPVLEFSGYTLINRDALTNNQNPWYQMHPTNRQTDGGGNPICRRQDLRSTILNIVVNHEADHINFSSAFWANPSNNVNALAEAVVSNTGSQGVADQTYDLIASIRAVEDAQNTAATDPVNFPCVLLGI
jgi:hypothetical protein